MPGCRSRRSRPGAPRATGAGAAQAGFLARQPLAGCASTSPASSAVRFLAFGEQAGELFLAGCGRRRFAFGAGELARGSACSSRRERAGFVAGRRQLRFQRVGIGRAGRTARAASTRPAARRQRRPRRRRREQSFLSSSRPPRRRPRLADFVSDSSQVDDNPQGMLATERRPLSPRGRCGWRGRRATATTAAATPSADPDLAPVAAAQVAEGEADRRLAELVVHQLSPPPRARRIRCAIRDCSDQSSMKPGEAVCEKRPPDSAKPARSAS